MPPRHSTSRGCLIAGDDLDAAVGVEPGGEHVGEFGVGQHDRRVGGDPDLRVVDAAQRVHDRLDRTRMDAVLRLLGHQQFRQRLLIQVGQEGQGEDRSVPSESPDEVTRYPRRTRRRSRLVVLFAFDRPHAGDLGQRGTDVVDPGGEPVGVGGLQIAGEPGDVLPGLLQPRGRRAERAGGASTSPGRRRRRLPGAARRTTARRETAWGRRERSRARECRTARAAGGCRCPA